MSAWRHTPGPWTWDERRHALRPVVAQSELSHVHTVLSPDGCFGYVGKDIDAVLVEVGANRALIAAFPLLLAPAVRTRGALATRLDLPMEHLREHPAFAALDTAIEAASKASAGTRTNL
jgi:hypothetical protein